MIESIHEDLSLQDAKQLEIWLRQAGAQIFIKVLQHRAKAFQVEAMNQARSNTDGYANLATDSLKKATEAENFSNLFTQYADGKIKPTTVKLS